MHTKIDKINVTNTNRDSQADDVTTMTCSCSTTSNRKKLTNEMSLPGSLQDSYLGLSWQQPQAQPSFTLSEIHTQTHTHTHSLYRHYIPLHLPHRY